MENKNAVDIYLFHRGEHLRAYEYLGAHPYKEGTIFRTWAPRAKNISLVGNFNNWTPHQNYFNQINNEGIWELYMPDVKEGELYKLAIEDHNCHTQLKSDPYAFYSELRPNTASIVHYLNDYSWSDKKWIEKRDGYNHYEKPMNIYELHLGSWKRHGLGENEFYTYREIAEELPKYIIEMGYTHVEFMPLGEYPLDASWGYQGIGYFSPTSRYGKPEDLKYLIDKLHKAGIGVILDWVPGHYCKDSHGLYYFDGTPTYEYEWNLMRENDQWGTANFDLGRNEVRSFLISNALYWMREFHIDGIRIDAVANMLYMDFGKENPALRNQYGSNENIVAVEFLQKLNKAILEEFPGNYVFAEESTAWPQVTKPDYVGGLGFTYKWNMGWMNDTLEYAEHDSYFRKWHHNNLTFSFVYAYAENYTLPLSHDEVVHGKRSLLDKMPGNYEEMFANLRSLYAYMMGTPGKKLLFMGGEFGQFIEWRFYEDLDWHLLDYQKHKELSNYVKELNHLYKKEPALWENDVHDKGFEWIDCLNYHESILVFIRKGHRKDEFIICAYNFTTVPRGNYYVGVPEAGTYKEIINSDWEHFGGNQSEVKEYKTSSDGWHDRPHKIELDLPPLSSVYLKLTSKNK